MREGIALDVDVRGLDHVLARVNLAAKNVRKATKFALNDSGRTVRVAVQREVRRDIGITIKTVRRYSRVFVASEAKLAWEMSASTKGIVIDDLQARPTRRGITYRDQGSRKLGGDPGRRAFWLPSRGSRYSAPGSPANRPAMQRTSGRRKPLQVVRGPSLLESITRSYRTHQAVVGRTFPRNFARHARRFGVVF
jgi:hypothetical protein